MKGREYGEQQKAYKANRLMQGLQFNAQTAAQQYIGFAQTNPEAVSKMFELDKLRSNQNPSPEDQKKILDLSSGKDVQQAQLYRDGSHTARAKMMEMYGNYINPPKKDKGKGKAKGGDQSGEQQNPILMAQSKDPREKSQGVWALASRFDPADIAVRQYASPEYLAQRKLTSERQQASVNILDKELRMQELENPPRNPDPQKRRPRSAEEDSELKTLYDDPQIPGNKDRLAMAQKGHKIIANSLSKFQLTDDYIKDKSLDPFRQPDGTLRDSYGIPLKAGEQVAIGNTESGGTVLLAREGAERILHGIDTGEGVPYVATYTPGSGRGVTPIAPQSVVTGTTRNEPAVDPATGKMTTFPVTTKRQYGGGPQVPAPAAGPAAGTAAGTVAAPAAATPSAPATPPAKPSRADRAAAARPRPVSQKELAVPLRQYTALNRMATPVINAGTQVLGDPNHPDAPSLLKSVALFDDPTHREKIGTAFRMIMSHVGEEEASTGNVSKVISAGANLDQYVSNAFTKEYDQYLSGLDDDERQAVDLLT